MPNSRLLHRALALIPGAAQTDTKCPEERVLGSQPDFFVEGKGSYARDPEGNWWLDCQMGLAAYILGYNDSYVNSSVVEQLTKGSLFSLSSTLEMDVAQILLDLFPEFSKVRFSKNGSDVTSTAIRIARYHTGRDHVLGCGYHGFQDWSMSLLRDIGGIPRCVRDLSQGQEQVDLNAVLNTLDEFPRRFAAVIVDTGGSGVPDLALLNRVRQTCRSQGTVFIMDEVISGFRVSLRGVVGFSGIVPDLICFGKAVSNGFPLSVLMGSDELLKLAPVTVMSSTHGGDCIALAAAKATLEQLKDGSINASINMRGTELMKAIEVLLDCFGMHDFFDFVGYPALSVLVPKTKASQSKAALRFLMRALATHKIFWQGSFVLCRDFEEEELKVLLTALKAAFTELALLVRHGRLETINQQILQEEKSYLAHPQNVAP
jgi:glutamate-1-semialdehyde 2,1-aminomutase